MVRTSDTDLSVGIEPFYSLSDLLEFGKRILGDASIRILTLEELFPVLETMRFVRTPEEVRFFINNSLLNGMPGRSFVYYIDTDDDPFYFSQDVKQISIDKTDEGRVEVRHIVKGGYKLPG